MSLKSKFQNHDMNAYSDANFGMVKRLTQKVESLWGSDRNDPAKETEKKEKTIELFEEEIYLHFY